MTTTIGRRPKWRCFFFFPRRRRTSARLPLAFRPRSGPRLCFSTPLLVSLGLALSSGLEKRSRRGALGCFFVFSRAQ